MKELLKIQNILKAHPQDWKDFLSNKPYNLNIKEDENLVIFNYNMIKSTLSNKAVQESRGLILEKDTWDIVCHPFNKFFNYGESNAHVINWKKAIVLEKIDGSFIKVYNYKDEWKVATNGTINAFKAPVQNDLYNGTYGDLFLEAINKLDFFNFQDFTNSLDKGVVYFFELVSPYTRVVIPYSETEVFLLGARDKITDKEFFPEMFEFKVPKKYNISSIEGCIKAAEKLPYDKEGYVVFDGKHRLKIKSPAYLVEHHLKNNGALTKKRIIDLIKFGKDDDFIGKFPEFANDINKVKESYKNFLFAMETKFEEIKNITYYDRKSFAMQVIETPFPAFFFQWYDGKVKDVEEYLNNMDSEKLADIL